MPYIRTCFLILILAAMLSACGGGDVQNPAATDTSQSGFEPKLPLPRAAAEITPVGTSSALASQAVNLQDAIAILKMIVGLEVNSSGQPVTAYQAYAADVDGNGKVELTDAITVLKRVVGLETQTANWLFFNQTDSAPTVSDRLNPGIAPDLKAYVTSAATSNVGLVAVLRGDVVGSEFSYAWSLTSKPPNSSATLTGANAVSPTFTVDVVGSYVATLTVSDGSLNTSLTRVTLAAALVLPGMPTIGAATPEDSRARIEFIPGATGDHTVTYTASCAANGATTVTSKGTASPITVTGLTNGVAYACKITPSSVAGIGSASGSASVTPVITPLFASTPILLPDLKAKYDALCGNQVSVQNAIPANLTGHTDGKRDLVFNLWCGQVAGTVTTAPTVNGVVALIQQADGSFVDGTRTLFGVDMVDLIGNGGQSVVYDFNGDGKDDIVFAVTGEDGRALPQGFSGNNRQNVFLTSKQDGTYSVERLGPYSYNAYISLLDNEVGGKDVSISTIGYGGTNTTWRYQNGWTQLSGYNWLISMAVFFKRTASNLASTTAIIQANAGISLFTRTNGSAWTSSSNWSFPNPKSVPWQGWNGDLGNASMVTYNGKDYASVVFENGCELKLKPTDTTTVAIMALNTLEIVGGYQGGTIVESSSYLKSITKLMAFTTSNNTLTNINLPVTNEFQSVQFFQISCGDLNGDGSDDILVMPWGANAVPIIYLNDGAGNFNLVETSKLPLPSTSFQEASMIYLDINGDGIRDLLYWPLTAISGNPSKVQYQIFKGLRAANATDKK